MTDNASPLDAIRRRFLLRLAEQRAELEQLSPHAENNRQTQDIVHKIAGIAGSLGFPELSSAAITVETLLVQETAAILPASREFAVLMSCIEAALDNQTPAADAKEWPAA